MEQGDLSFLSILFNFEGPVEIQRTSKDSGAPGIKWGCSSAGRAPALHAGGQEFEPPHLHHWMFRA